MADVLFEITADDLETGLRGFPVGFCSTSHIDPHKGLYYVDIPILEIGSWEPEETIYLLYHRKKGSIAEVAKFAQELQRRAICPPHVLDAIEQLPRNTHPMKLLSIAILLMASARERKEYQEDCLDLIAKIPHLVATLINYHGNWGKTPLPDPTKGYMENFTHMIQAPGGRKKTLTDVFRLFNILHYDHGGGNLSTFVGKAVASGLEDMYGSISAAMNALAGPRHGKANQDCLLFVKEILDEVGPKGGATDVATRIRSRLAHNQLIFGFGHAVLRVEDPRATILYEYATRHFFDHSLVHIALLLRNEGQKILAENGKVTNPHPNVDAISGVVLAAAGFDHPEYFTVLFGLSRVVGIAIQIVEERCYARGGKGTPIVRPKYLYRPHRPV